MLSLTINRYGNNLTNDVLDKCDHAEFVFSSGYIANCHSNGNYMITDFYHKISKNHMTALDIGSSHGNHTKIMRDFGLKVDQIDKYEENADINEDEPKVLISSTMDAELMND